MPQTPAAKATRVGPIFYTCQQVATMLGLNVHTVYVMADQKLLDSRYQGRRRYITVASLDTYLASLSDLPEQP